jgi:hypothetical protein
VFVLNFAGVITVMNHAVPEARSVRIGGLSSMQL